LGKNRFLFTLIKKAPLCFGSTAVGYEFYCSHVSGCWLLVTGFWFLKKSFIKTNVVSLNQNKKVISNLPTGRQAKNQQLSVFCIPVCRTGRKLHNKDL
jgi:hypothetical protein